MNKYIYIGLGGLAFLIVIGISAFIIYRLYERQKFMKATKSIKDAQLEKEKEDKRNKKKYPRSERSKKLMNDLESGFPWGLDLKDVPDSEPEEKQLEAPIISEKDNPNNEEEK